MGLGWWRERTTSAAPERIETAKAPRMAALVHPQVEPSTMAAARLATEIDSNTAPRRSAGWASGSFTSRSTLTPTTRAIRLKGRLTRNTQRQLACTSSPPMGGPKAAAAPPTADHRPMAAPLRAGPKAGRRRPREVGSIKAPPPAWRMRAATSNPSDGASAHRADETVKMPRPRRNAFLRPARSAQRPAGTSNEANTMV